MSRKSHGHVNDCNLKCIGAGDTSPHVSGEESAISGLRRTEKTKIRRMQRLFYSPNYSPLSTLKICSLQAPLDPFMNSKASPITISSQKSSLSKTSVETWSK